MPTKKRGWNLVLKGYNRSPAASWKPYSYTFANTETSVGMTHPGWKTAGGSDIGGPWFMDRTIRVCSPIVLKSNFANGPYFSQGITSWSGTGFSTNISDNEVITAGTKSIRLASPTNPTASLSVALGELRTDGLPHVIGAEQIKAKTQFLKGSGSEYLNVQFGWLPLVSDLRSFANAVKHGNKIISQYRQGSDRKIRRRRNAEPVRGFKTMTGGGYLQPTTPVYPYDGSETEENLTQSWFSGAFRYHVPVGNDLAAKLATYESNANKLLGLRLTPDVVWNLAPWSWAADWFANTGDVLTNISNLGQDGLVMQYGYQMLHKRQETTVYFSLSGGRSGFFRTLHEQKRRIPASPYGFGLTFDGMTSRQKAICAALAITRVR